MWHSSSNSTVAFGTNTPSAESASAAPSLLTRSTIKAGRTHQRVYVNAPLVQMWSRVVTPDHHYLRTSEICAGCALTRRYFVDELPSHRRAAERSLTAAVASPGVRKLC